MGLNVTHLERRIGSLVETDLETLLSGEAVQEIRDLLEERGVLVFRGCEMDDEQQLAFTRTFGDVYDAKSGAVYKVSFDKKDSPDHWHYSFGTMSWHIDRTDTDLPPFASILRGVRLAPEGGDTMFANTYAAYDDLSEEDKRRFSTLEGVHSQETIQRKAFPDPTETQLALWGEGAIPATAHPLVWHHRSGRKSLLVGQTMSRIVGLDKEESDALVERILAHAEQRQYIYSHDWQLGDILIWDNTGTMHRVVPFDLDCGRELQRVKLSGEEPIMAPATEPA